MLLVLYLNVPSKSKASIHDVPVGRNDLFLAEVLVVVSQKSSLYCGSDMSYSMEEIRLYHIEYIRKYLQSRTIIPAIYCRLISLKKHSFCCYKENNFNTRLNGYPMSLFTFRRRGRYMPINRKGPLL